MVCSLFPHFAEGWGSCAWLTVAMAKGEGTGGRSLPTQWQIQDFPLGGCQPPMHTLFGENVCENERNGSCWGGMHWWCPLDPPMPLVRAFWEETGIELAASCTKLCWELPLRGVFRRRERGAISHVITFLDDVAMHVPSLDAWDQFVWPLGVAMPWRWSSMAITTVTP